MTDEVSFIWLQSLVHIVPSEKACLITSFSSFCADSLLDSVIWVKHFVTQSLGGGSKRQNSKTRTNVRSSYFKLGGQLADMLRYREMKKMCNNWGSRGECETSKGSSQFGVGRR